MDRRRLDRITAGYAAVLHSGSRRHHCVVENISPGGMCLTSLTGEHFPDFHHSEIITVAVEAPSGAVLHRACSVMWAEKTLPRGARTLVGVEIISPSWEGTDFIHYPA